MKRLLHELRHLIGWAPTEIESVIMGGQFIRVRCVICGRTKVLG